MSTVITNSHNYSDCRFSNISLPIFADDIHLAPDVILYCPDPTILHWSVYRNIKYLAIANKTTKQDSELRKIDWDWSENFINQASKAAHRGRQILEYKTSMPSENHPGERFGGFRVQSMWSHTMEFLVTTFTTFCHVTKFNCANWIEIPLTKGRSQVRVLFRPLVNPQGWGFWR